MAANTAGAAVGGYTRLEEEHFAQLDPCCRVRIVIHMGGIGQRAKHLLRAFQQAGLGVSGGDEPDAQSACAD